MCHKRLNGGHPEDLVVPVVRGSRFRAGYHQHRRWTPGGGQHFHLEGPVQKWDTGHTFWQVKRNPVFLIDIENEF
jgi:hypothetical protein